MLGNYFLRYSKSYQIPLGFVSTFSQGATFGGTLGITKKWQAAVNGSYNITQGKLTQVSLSLSRDLHCWQMSIAVSQSPLSRFFSINISPKSSLLHDLRVNRTRTFYPSL